MILVDAHVHIYDCFNLESFLDAAYSNFQSAAAGLGRSDKFTPILLLTETAKDNWFDRFKKYAEAQNEYGGRAIQKWSFHNTGERKSLCARSWASRFLFIIAGRQVETAEGLEVLALCTTNRFKSGTPLIPLVEEVKRQDAIPVIPWGFGKWLRRRGKILDNFMELYEDLKFYLGDNSGRPSFLPYPRHFTKAQETGIRILPGSDPLPFTREYDRAGFFGFFVEGELSRTSPAKGLKQILMGKKSEIQPYGRLENPLRFFRNQIGMQIKKHFLRQGK